MEGRYTMTEQTPQDETREEKPEPRDAQGRRRGRGRDEYPCRGTQGRRSSARLREDVAEDLQGQLRRRRRYARRGYQDLERELQGLLARGEPVLRAAGRHHARRGRPHFRLAARRSQALDGRDGPLRR